MDVKRLLKHYKGYAKRKQLTVYLMKTVHWWRIPKRIIEMILQHVVKQQLFHQRSHGNAANGKWKPIKSIIKYNNNDNKAPTRIRDVWRVHRRIDSYPRRTAQKTRVGLVRAFPCHENRSPDHPPKPIGN